MTAPTATPSAAAAASVSSFPSLSSSPSPSSSPSSSSFGPTLLETLLPIEYKFLYIHTLALICALLYLIKLTCSRQYQHSYYYYYSDRCSSHASAHDAHSTQLQSSPTAATTMPSAEHPRHWYVYYHRILTCAEFLFLLSLKAYLFWQAVYQHPQYSLEMMSIDIQDAAEQTTHHPSATATATATAQVTGRPLEQVTFLLYFLCKVLQYFGMYVLQQQWHKIQQLQLTTKAHTTRTHTHTTTHPNNTSTNQLSPQSVSADADVDTDAHADAQEIFLSSQTDWLLYASYKYLFLFWQPPVPVDLPRHTVQHSTVAGRNEPESESGHCSFVIPYTYLQYMYFVQYNLWIFLPIFGFSFITAYHMHYIDILGFAFDILFIGMIWMDMITFDEYQKVGKEKEDMKLTGAETRHQTSSTRQHSTSTTQQESRTTLRRVQPKEKAKTRTKKKEKKEEKTPPKWGFLFGYEDDKVIEEDYESDDERYTRIVDDEEDDNGSFSLSLVATKKENKYHQHEIMKQYIALVAKQADSMYSQLATSSSSSSSSSSSQKQNKKTDLFDFCQGLFYHVIVPFSLFLISFYAVYVYIIHQTWMFRGPSTHFFLLIVVIYLTTGIMKIMERVFRLTRS